MKLGRARPRPPRCKTSRKEHTHLSQQPQRSLSASYWLCLGHVPTQVAVARRNLNHASHHEVNHIISPAAHGVKGGSPEKNLSRMNERGLGKRRGARYRLRDLPKVPQILTDKIRIQAQVFRNQVLQKQWQSFENTGSKSQKVLPSTSLGWSRSSKSSIDCLQNVKGSQAPFTT